VPEKVVKAEEIVKSTLAAVGLAPLARKTLGALGLEYVPTTAPKGDDLYPEAIPPEKFDSTTKISFPQADRCYHPSLFWPTEKRKARNRINTGLDIKAAFLTLYGTMRRLGWAVNGCRPDKADLTFEWAGKHVAYHPKRPPLVMEHGWLPRSTYQISETGANARSHVAASYRFRRLEPRQEQLVCNHLDRMRRLFSLQLDEAGIARVAQRFGEPFILFPLQLANDFNLRYSNSPFEDLYHPELRRTVRFAQACVDHLEAVRLPLPIVFKQHPSDPNDLRATLKLNERNRLVTNDEKIGTVGLLASGRCKLVISVNSNTLHEGLAWNVPGISLGTLLWDESREDRPLEKDPAAAERLLGQETVLDATRLSYLHHVITHQWLLSDFQNPLIVQELIRARGYCVPHELRCRLGFDLAWAGEPDDSRETVASDSARDRTPDSWTLCDMRDTTC
jgi:hypothetical protein